MSNLLTKREFIRTLIASVITVGVPLPIGFKPNLEVPIVSYIAMGGDGINIKLKYWYLYKNLQDDLVQIDPRTVAIQLRTSDT